MWLYGASYLPVVEDVYDWTTAVLLTGDYMNGSIGNLYSNVLLQSYLKLLDAGFCGSDPLLESAHVALVVLAGIGRLEGQGAGAYAPGYIPNLEASEPRARQGPDTTWHFFYHSFLAFESLYCDKYGLSTGSELRAGIGYTAKLIGKRVDIVKQQYDEYEEDYGFEDYYYLSEGDKAGNAY